VFVTDCFRFRSSLVPIEDTTYPLMERHDDSGGAKRARGSRRASRLALAVAAAAAALALAAPGGAAAAVRAVAVATASSPVFMTNAGDARLFVVERGGRIRIFDRAAGSFLATPFLDLSALVSGSTEQGLLSMAFHPDFAANGLFFVYYTDLAGNVVIARYHVGANPNVADATSAATLLTIAHPFNNHNGGQLQIGPRDGYLYIGVGDGGSEGDPSCFGQRTDTMLGKLLRLDVRQNLARAPFYGIPADNPFLAGVDPGNQIADEIWATGVRNPWRFSFDRATGDLYIGDVGQDSFEEVDLHPAGTAGGQNYGWKVMEGFHCFSTSGCPATVPACNALSLTLPILEYSHSAGCSIIGGYLYRGRQAPELFGRYVFSDFCSGGIHASRQTSPGVWDNQTVLTTASGVTSFGEDGSGELFVAVGNDIFQLVSDSAGVPAVPAALLLALAMALAATGAARLAVRRPNRRLGG
jgi:glucose/arabinose dehydrogenase